MISVKKQNGTIVTKSVLPARKATKQPFVNDIDFGEVRPAKVQKMDDMTMQELSRQGWFDQEKKDSPEPLHLPGTTEPDGSDRVVVPGQTYCITPQDGDAYWVQWNAKAKGILFMGMNDLTLKKMVLSYQNNGPLPHNVQELSLSRFADVLKMKPTIAQLYAQYKFMPVENQSMDKNPLNLTNATPVW